MSRSMILGLVLTLGLASCGGEPTIDTSSFSDYEDSFEQVKQSLPEEDRELFEESFGLVVMESGVNPLSFAMRMSSDPDGKVPTAVVNAVGGKTGPEIIEAAQPLLEEERRREEKERRREQEAREQEIARYEELLEIREADKRAALMLESVRITDIKMAAEDAYSMGQGFTAQVENGTELPIQQLAAEIDLVSPDRSSPWMELEISTKIAGGIEPGETREIEFLAGAFNGWRSQVDLPDNIQMEGVATRFTTPDDQRISPDTMGAYAQLEFDRLHEKYGGD